MYLQEQSFPQRGKHAAILLTQVATKAYLRLRDIILLQSKTLRTGKFFTKDM